MPFTVSHSAIAVPVLRWLRTPYAASALVVGTMAPDFEYFLRLRVFASISHTIPGLLMFCLPVGAAVLLAFHLVVKRPATLLLPDALRGRIAAAHETRRVRMHDVAWIAVLIVAGASTHLAWDGFTHARGWAVRQWPALSAVVFSGIGSKIAVYTVLQHTSTLAGLTALIVAAVVWLRRRPAVAPPDSGLAPAMRWIVVVAILAVSVVAGGVGAAAGLATTGGPRAFQIAVSRFVVASIVGFALSLVAFSVIVLKRGKAARWPP